MALIPPCCSERCGSARNKTESATYRLRLSVFFSCILLLYLFALAAPPTAAWQTAARAVATVSGCFSAARSPFDVALTIAPLSSGDAASAPDIADRTTRFDGLCPGDTYDITITIRNRTQTTCCCDVAVDRMSLTAADGTALPVDVCCIGVPADEDGIAYYAESAPHHTADGWQYHLCSALTLASIASIAAVDTGEDITLRLRLQVRDDLTALGLSADALSGAVFRIGSISVMDTTTYE